MEEVHHDKTAEWKKFMKSNMCLQSLLLIKLIQLIVADHRNKVTILTTCEPVQWPVSSKTQMVSEEPRLDTQ